MTSEGEGRVTWVTRGHGGTKQASMGDKIGVISPRTFAIKAWDIIQTRTPGYGTDALAIPHTRLISHSFQLTHALSRTPHGEKNMLFIILHAILVPRGAKGTQEAEIEVS